MNGAAATVLLPAAAGGAGWRRAGGYGRCVGVGVVVLAAVVLNQSAVHWRTDLYDDDLFAYHGWCVSQGLRPYLDIWDNKPPGIWWLNALAVRVMGEGQPGIVLICGGGLLVGLLALTALAGRVYGPGLMIPAALLGALLLGDLRYDGGANRTETFVVAFETVGVLSYVAWVQSRKLRWLAAGGLAAGSAAVFKQAGLAAATACLLHLLWLSLRTQRIEAEAHPRANSGGWRRPIALWPGSLWPGSLCPVALWIACCAAVPLLAMSVLAVQGALGEAIFAVGAFNRAYFLVGDATWLRLDRALTVARPILAPLALWLLLAAAALVLGCWRGLRRASGQPETPAAREAIGALNWLPLWAGWLMLAGYLALVGPGRRGHHFLPLMPPLALTVLYFLQALLTDARTGRPAWVAVLCGHPLRLAVLVLVGYGALRFGLGNWREQERSWGQKTAWWSLDRHTPRPGEQQAAEIRRLTEPDERIFVAGWSPSTYRHALRLPASRFMTFEKLGQVGAYAQFIHDGAFADLRRDPPAVFVISIADHQRLRAAEDQRDARWLAEHYRLSRTVEGMEIHQRLR